MAESHRSDGEQTIHVRRVSSLVDPDRYESTVVIDRWIDLLDRRVEGYRAMAGQCSELQDWHEAAKLRMKSDAMREIASDIRKLKKQIDQGHVSR